MDGPAGLCPNTIDEKGEGSGEHVQSGVFTGAGGISIGDRYRRAVILLKILRGLPIGRKIGISSHPLLRDQWGPKGGSILFKSKC